MTHSHVIVIDQGTHSTRAIIYDQAGEAIFKAQQAVKLFYSEKYHVEQDGNRLLESCRQVINEADKYIQKNRLQNIAAALTTQRSTVIAWDLQTGKALTPALSWLDTRAQNYLHELKLSDTEIKTKTGLPASPHYGASKLRWLLAHNTKVQQAKEQGKLLFGPLAAYLIFNLVDSHPALVDYANAHRTLLWNLQTRDWDEALLNAFSIDSLLLPKPVANTHDYGKLNGTSYPLVLVNGDQNSAVYGYGKLSQNTTLVNIGTGGFVLAISNNKPIVNTKLLASITYSSNTDQEYALEGTINGAGAAITWAKDAWAKGVWDTEDLDDVQWHDAQDIPVFINTVGGLGSPWWTSTIEPAFLDTQKTYLNYSKQQCKAALMESIAFLITRNIEELRDYGIQSKQLVVAGGLSTDVYLCQRLANLCSAPVNASNYKEATSRGAAWLAMGRPDWEPLDYVDFIPDKNEALASRYQQFNTAIDGLVH